MRHDYTIVLEIRPTTPLTHGAGNLGNEQQLRRQSARYHDPEIGEWISLEYPSISASAFKATLRECAVEDAFESLGVPEGGVSMDALRLLLKGGKTTSAGQSVSVDEMRRMADLFPLLAVFGSMDGGNARPSRFRCTDIRPWSESLARAGLLPRSIRPLRALAVDAPDPEGEIPVYPGLPPIPDDQIECRQDYYAHDLRNGSTGQRYLTGAAQAQLADGRAAVAAKRKAGIKPDKEERREANESMPHSFQAIAPGTPLVCTIRLDGVNEIEFTCLARALTRWIAQGGRLGGAAGSKGHGQCSVRVAGAIRHQPSPGALETPPTEALLAIGEGATEAFRRFDAHLSERRDAILAELSR